MRFATRAEQGIEKEEMHLFILQSLFHFHDHRVEVKAGAELS